MRAIWKYPLQITDHQHLLIPEKAEILSVEFQGETLCLWAEVEMSYPKEDRVIQIVGTGNPILNSGRKFIGTVQQGPLVWHIFEAG